MHVISKKKITDFIKKYPDSESSLLSWYSIVNAEIFSDLNALRNWFPNADLVGRRTVFNIGGNKYRMITRVNFVSGKIFILYILTHSEYSKDKWKKDGK
jgi:mRNA interferase HigB